MILSTIVTYLGWPNSYFIPDDPCTLVFFDPTNELLAEEAIGVITHQIPGAVSFMNKIQAKTLGTLIGQLVEQQGEGDTLSKTHPLK